MDEQRKWYYGLLKSRKFWMTMLGFISASGAFAGGAIGAEEWVTAIVAFIGVLVASIAAEDAAEKF
jgi:hypothetical protein